MLCAGGHGGWRVGAVRAQPGQAVHRPRVGALWVHGRGAGGGGQPPARALGVRGAVRRGWPHGALFRLSSIWRAVDATTPALVKVYIHITARCTGCIYVSRPKDQLVSSSKAANATIRWSCAAAQECSTGSLRGIILQLQP